MNAPQITILTYREVPGITKIANDDAELIQGDVLGISLDDALTNEWPQDAHLTQYEPFAIDGAFVRIDKEAVTSGEIPLRMTCIVGDIDAPKHKFDATWWAKIEPKLNASGLQWYRTRNGAKVIMRMPEPIEICNDGDWNDWRDLYLDWVEFCEQEHGLVLDPKCSDPTRIFRLPNVVRDRKPERSAVHGTAPMFDIVEHTRPMSVDKKRKVMATVGAESKSTGMSADPRDPRIIKAVMAVVQMPPSIAGEGGNEALFRAGLTAKDALGDLAEDPANIKCVLRYFNLSCGDDPWPDSQLMHEAKRRAAEAATPEERYGRRHAANADAQFAQPTTEPPDPSKYADGLAQEVVGRNELADLSKPKTPIRWLCEGLQIGWVGKVAGIHGYASSSKSPFTNLFALCVASGKPFLGQHAVERTPVVLFDAETGVTVEDRLKSLTGPLQIDLGRLQAEGWLTLVHVSETLEEMLGSGFIERVTERVNRGNGVMWAFDSLSSMTKGDEKSSEYAEPLWALGRLARAQDCVAVMLLHDRKDHESNTTGGGQKISGSNRLFSALATSIGLESDKDDKCKIKVCCDRSPKKEFEPFSIEWRDTNAEGDFEAVSEAVQVQSKLERAQEKARAQSDKHLKTVSKYADAVESLLTGCVADNMTAKKIRSTISMSGDDWLDVRQEMLRRASVTENKTGRYPTYRLNTGPRLPALLPRVHVSAPVKRPTIAELKKVAPTGMNSAQGKTWAISKSRRDAKRLREGVPAPA